MSKYRIQAANCSSQKETLCNDLEDLNNFSRTDGKQGGKVKKGGEWFDRMNMVCDNCEQRWVENNEEPR